MAGQAPNIAQNAVLVPSGDLPVEPVEVKGYDFNEGIDYSRMLKTFGTTGFQATQFARAVNEINRMVRYTGWAVCCFLLCCGSNSCVFMLPFVYSCSLPI